MPAVLLAALSAAAYATAFPPWERVALSWLALAPLVAALDRAGGALRGAALGAGWALAATAGVIAWVAPTLAGYFGLPWPQALALFALVCAASAAPYYAALGALVAGTRRHLPRSAWLLLFPAAWVAAEWARTELGLRSAWATLGAAHHESERLRQLADVGGVYGISALVALGNVVAAEAFSGLRARARRAPFDVRPLRCVAVVFGLALAAALAYGEARRAPAREGGPEVLLVQGAVAPELTWRRARARQVLQRYAALTREALAAGPVAFVLWPENAVQTAPDDPLLGPPLRDFVRRAGVPILLGAPRREIGADGAMRHFNAAHLLRPDGTTAHYDKIRLLPLAESGFGGARGDLDATEWSAGDEPDLLDAGGERLGVLICLEAIDARMARALAAGGATALVNLANDGWFRGRGGARQHLQLAAFRAIESGLPLVRATTTGLTVVIAPDGRVTARLAPDSPGALRAALPARRRTPTLYTRMGDLFAAVCVLACAAAGARALRPRLALGRQPARSLSASP